MAWMDCSRALLKDFIELCKSAKKKIISTLIDFILFLTSSHLDRPKIDPSALPFPVRYRILLSSLLSPAKASYRATAAFLTPPLTSSSSRHALNCHTTFPFIVAPPVLPSSSR